MWKVKAKVVPVIIGILGTMTPKLEKWLQQITTSEISIQESADTAKVLR